MTACARCSEPATVRATFDPPFTAAPLVNERVMCDDCLPRLWRTAARSDRKLILVRL